MKILRILAFTVLAICIFGSVKAQVVVRARIGQPVHRRVVVVHHPIHRYHRYYRPHHVYRHPVRHYHRY